MPTASARPSVRRRSTARPTRMPTSATSRSSSMTRRPAPRRSRSSAASRTARASSVRGASATPATTRAAPGASQCRLSGERRQPGICGGKRCLGGPNMRCALHRYERVSDEFVRASGEPTKPNGCVDDSDAPGDGYHLRGHRRRRRAMSGRADRQQLRPSEQFRGCHRGGGLSAHRELRVREPTLLPRYGRSHGNARAGGRLVCGYLLHRPDRRVGGQQRGRSPRSRRVDPPYTLSVNVP